MPASRTSVATISCVLITIAAVIAWFMMGSTTFTFSVSTPNTASSTLDEAATPLIDTLDTQTATLPNAESSPAETLRNVTYATVNNTALKLDMYLPDRTLRPVPVILWFHGGAWTMGNKIDGSYPAQFAVPRGFALVSVQYRFSQRAKFPAQIQDCRAAVQFLRHNAEQYHIDPRRIGAWGASSGGHLALLLAYADDDVFPTTDHAIIGDDDGSANNITTRISAVCDWFGPADLVDAVERLQTRPNDWRARPIKRLFGTPLAESMDIARIASPVTYITSDDPPTLIMHGLQDSIVELEQSERLHELCQRASVPSALVVRKNSGHAFLAPTAYWKAVRFFEQRLGPMGPVKRAIKR